MPRYGLASLVEYFKIEHGRAHRALDDALATSNVYLALIAHLAALAPASREAIGKLLFGADGITKFRVALRVSSRCRECRQASLCRKLTLLERELYPDNVAGEIPERVNDDYIPVDMGAVENCFLPGGLLSKGMATYEYRPQQIKMAVRVAQTFNQSEFLLAEAPTGVGKSLAYLLPASWWASQNGERVIIFTQRRVCNCSCFTEEGPAGILDGRRVKFIGIVERKK